jgi:glycosyltransferase involved in cell wall biosynthesis
VDFAPLPRRLGEVLNALDLVVPFTRFAKTALESWLEYEGIGAKKLAAPIPHGVDTAIFRPLPIEQREAVRRRVFKADTEKLVVGFFGRNSSHKHPDLAVRIFHLFATGSSWKCRDCGQITPFELDPIDLSVKPAGVCGACGSGHGSRGSEHPEALLYLHTEPLSGTERLAAGGWDLNALITKLGIRQRIRWDRDLAIGRGLPVEELAKRMAGCDLHLLPFDCGGWELTVLETGACGVPNIITDYAAPPEYARPSSACIPVNAEICDPAGFRGLLDLGQALEALETLANSPEQRTGLGSRGVATARKLGWDAIVNRWRALLSGC